VAVFDRVCSISLKQLWKQEKLCLISNQIEITFWNGKCFSYLQMANLLLFRIEKTFHMIEKTSSALCFVRFLAAMYKTGRMRQMVKTSHSIFKSSAQYSLTHSLSSIPCSRTRPICAAVRDHHHHLSVVTVALPSSGFFPALFKDKSYSWIVTKIFNGWQQCPSHKMCFATTYM